MFANHQPTIQAYAARGPLELARVARFVFLTIQEPLARVPDYLARVDGGDTAPLWGSKLAGDTYWQEHARELWSRLRALNSLQDSAPMLALVSQLPGLGFAKGGFLLQLAFGRVGCLDSHNLKRFGLDPKVAAPRKLKRAASIERHARNYLEACERFGGCESLWNTWCQFVAEREGYGRELGAFGVSALHCEALGLT